MFENLMTRDYARKLLATNGRMDWDAWSQLCRRVRSGDRKSRPLKPDEVRHLVEQLHPKDLNEAFIHACDVICAGTPMSTDHLMAEIGKSAMRSDDEFIDEMRKRVAGPNGVEYRYFDSKSSGRGLDSSDRPLGLERR